MDGSNVTLLEGDDVFAAIRGPHWAATGTTLSRAEVAADAARHCVTKARQGLGEYVETLV